MLHHLLQLLFYVQSPHFLLLQVELPPRYLEVAADLGEGVKEALLYSLQDGQLLTAWENGLIFIF